MSKFDVDTYDTYGSNSMRSHGTGQSHSPFFLLKESANDISKFTMNYDNYTHFCHRIKVDTPITIESASTD